MPTEGCDDGLLAGVTPNPNPANRQPDDDHDTCPNGTATVDAGKACITYNRCNDGNPNLVDSTARCQEGRHIGAPRAGA